MSDYSYFINWLNNEATKDDILEVAYYVWHGVAMANEIFVVLCERMTYFDIRIPQEYEMWDIETGTWIQGEWIDFYEGDYNGKYELAEANYSILDANEMDFVFDDYNLTEILLHSLEIQDRLYKLDP